MTFHPIDPNQSISTGNVSQAKSSTNQNQNIKENTQKKELPANDRVALSEVQEDHRSIQNAINQIPDVRQEKIEHLKKAIESGEYHVSSEDLADRLIHDTIINRATD